MTFDLRPSIFDKPKSLIFVRHGQSTANVARHKSEAEKLKTIDFPECEIDVPLSERGVIESEKVGEWFKTQTEIPTIIVSSPYLRATETARIIIEKANLENRKILLDERIRERELGIFDRLTKLGAMEKYPEECAKREELGKFYYRPIGGESWADVALRVRSFWRDLRENFVDERILIVTHEVVIRVFRYVLEEMTVDEIMAIDRAGDVENGAITSYHFEGSKLILELNNYLPEI